MRILVATDAWHPQVNGVVRTLTKLADAAKSLGVEFSFWETSARAFIDSILAVGAVMPGRNGAEPARFVA